MRQAFRNDPGRLHDGLAQGGETAKSVREALVRHYEHPWAEIVEKLLVGFRPEEAKDEATQVKLVEYLGPATPRGARQLAIDNLRLLTGRDNLDYLLENLVDPSASVSADFRMSVVAMRDGRVLNGLVRAKTDRTLTLQMQTEALVLDRNDVEEVRPSAVSLMPEGLLDPLTAAEVRDLIAYLMQRTQVPLPSSK